MDCLKIVNIKVSCFFNEEMTPQVVKENGKVFTVYRNSKKLMSVQVQKNILSSHFGIHSINND